MRYNGDVQPPNPPLATINLEVQKQIGRLLAKENIRITVGDYSTAFFDVKERILGLPTWNTDNKDLSDLLISHEIGHALFTPEKGIEQFHNELPGVPFDVCNVVEDIRIERKIQEVYPGLVKAFKGGYSHLHEKDFFGIKSKDVNSLSFIDRLNLKGKLRDLISIEFSDWENEVLKKASLAETFDEVLEICKMIAKGDPDQKPENQKPEAPQPPAPKQKGEKNPGSPGSSSSPKPDRESQKKEDQDSSDDQDSSGKDSSDDQGSSKEKSEGQESEKDSQERSGGGDSSDDQASSEEEGDDGSEGSGSEGHSEERQNSQSEETSSETSEEGGSTGTNTRNPQELECSTAKNLSQSLESLQADYGKTVIVNTPTPEHFMSSVIPLAQVRHSRKNYNSYRYLTNMNDAAIHESWIGFKNSTKKNVSSLVREFDRKKSAYQYSRASVSDTGSINVNKLHSYKYNDQIFKSVTRLADAKNHGMMFFIDMSGSMGSALRTVIEQTLQLAFFCKTVGIPYEVYGFTSGINIQEESGSTKYGTNIRFGDTQVVELLNSSLSKKEWEEAAKELWVSQSLHQGNTFGNPEDSLGGTPLYNTIIIATELIKRFRDRNNVQKMNTLFLTDGASQELWFRNSDGDLQYNKSSKVVKTSRVMKWGSKMIPINPNSSTTYRDLIVGMKEQTGSSAICFYLPTGGSSVSKGAGIRAILGSTKLNHTSWDSASAALSSIVSKAKSAKEKLLLIPGGFGFDGYFVFQSVSGINLSKESSFSEEFTSDSDTSTASGRTSLAKAFTGHATEKKTARVFLNKFAEMIA